MIPILPSGDSSKRCYLHLSLSLLYLTPSSCAVKFPRKFLKVIHLNRPLRCQSCCFPCCLQEIEVIFFTSFVVIMPFVDCDHCPLSSFWCLSVYCDHCEDQVSSPPGSVIGTVEQEWSCLYPRFASSHFFHQPSVMGCCHLHFNHQVCDQGRGGF